MDRDAAYWQSLADRDLVMWISLAAILGVGAVIAWLIILDKRNGIKWLMIAVYAIFIITMGVSYVTI